MVKETIFILAVIAFSFYGLFPVRVKAEQAPIVTAVSNTTDEAFGLCERYKYNRDLVAGCSVDAVNKRVNVRMKIFADTAVNICRGMQRAIDENHLPQSDYLLAIHDVAGNPLTYCPLPQ